MSHSRFSSLYIQRVLAIQRGNAAAILGSIGDGS